MSALIRGRVSSQDPDAMELERHLCRTDLKYLCTEKLGMKDWDICHDEFWAWYQANRHNPDKMILIPRNHLKSSLITIGLTIQDILNDYNTKILLASAVWDNARTFLAELKSYLEAGDLPRLFGNFVSDKWNQDEIVIRQRTRPNKTSTIDTAGIEKSITGQHYDKIRADDLVTRETCTTKDQMEKVKKFHNDLLKLVDPRHGCIELIGTHWHFSDLYAEIKARNKIRLAAGQPLEYAEYVRMATADGSFNTAPIFPKFWTVEKLKKMQEQVGTYEYSCNYNNSPVSPKDQHFKPPVRYWNSLGIEPVFYITVDLANENGADFVVVMVAAMTAANQLCAVQYARGHFGHNTTMDHIFNFVVQYMMPQPSRKVGIESQAYQRIFIKLIEEEQKKRNIHFEVIPIIQSKDKFNRLLSLQPRYESGNLLLKQGMSELEDEMFTFPVGKNDDIMDTLEMAQKIADPRIHIKDKVSIPRQYRGWRGNSYLPDNLKRRGGYQ